MSVQVIGCLSATVLYLCFFFRSCSFGTVWKGCDLPERLAFSDPFEAAVSAPCGRVANASFLACPSSACSGVWPFRIRCQQFFGPSLAARVLATRNVLWIPKVTGSIFSGLCFWLA